MKTREGLKKKKNEFTTARYKKRRKKMYSLRRGDGRLIIRLSNTDLIKTDFISTRIILYFSITTETCPDDTILKC